MKLNWTILKQSRKRMKRVACYNISTRYSDRLTRDYGNLVDSSQHDYVSFIRVYSHMVSNALNSPKWCKCDTGFLHGNYLRLYMMNVQTCLGTSQTDGSSDPPKDCRHGSETHSFLWAPLPLLLHPPHLPAFPPPPPVSIEVHFNCFSHTSSLFIKSRSLCGI